MKGINMWKNILTDEVLLTDIQETAKKLDQQYLKIADYTKYGNYNSRNIIKRFGTLKKTLKLAGLDTTDNRSQVYVPRISEDELVEDLKRVSNLYDFHYLSMEKYQKNGKYDPSTITNRFGSWEKSLEKAVLISYDDKYIGKKYGYLIVIQRTNRKDSQNRFLWECRCQNCGKMTDVSIYNLERGVTISCGCLSQKESELARGTRDEKSDLRYYDYDKRLLKSNTSGFKGVWQNKNGTWVAELIVKGKKHRRYGFQTAKDAHEERLRLEEEYLPEDVLKRVREKQAENEETSSKE